MVFDKKVLLCMVALSGFQSLMALRGGDNRSFDHPAPIVVHEVSQQAPALPLTSAQVFKLVDVVAIAKGIKISSNNEPAPYPTGSMYSPFVSLTASQTIATFDYSPNFKDGTYSELWVSDANIALIPAGASVVFTGNVVPNAIGGYDAVVSAYNTTDTTTPIFSQQFPSIDVYSSQTTATTKVTAGTTAQPNTWDDTWVVYTLSDGSGNSSNIGRNHGFQFIPASVATNAGSSTLSIGSLHFVKTYQQFESLVSQATGNKLGQITTGPNQNISSFYIKLASDANNDSNVGNSITIGASGISFPPLLNSTVLTQGARFCILMFDTDGNMIVDMSKYNAAPFSIQLFCFTAQGDFLAAMAINPAAMTLSGQSTQGPWNSNYMSGNGFPGIYPAMLNFNMTPDQVTVENSASTITTATLTTLKAQPTFQAFEALITRATNKEISQVTDNSCMKNLVEAEQVPTGVYIKMAIDSNHDVQNGNGIAIAPQDPWGQGKNMQVPSFVDLANPNGNQFVLIVFDGNDTMISDMTTLAGNNPGSIHLFVFDGKTGVALGNISVDIDNMVIPGQKGSGPWNSNSMTGSVIGAPGLSISYPAALNVNTAVVIPSPSIYVPVLPVGTAFTSFDYSPNFINPGASAQLTIFGSNLELIPAGQPVVFTGNIIQNPSNGYDAVITAYNPNTQVVYFNQWYRNITYTGNMIQDTDEWSSTSVTYNNIQPPVQLGSSYGVQFGSVQYSALSVYMENGTTPGMFTEYSFSPTYVAKINAAIVSESGVVLSVSVTPVAGGGFQAIYNVVGAVSGKTIVSSGNITLQDASPSQTQINTNPDFANVVLAYKKVGNATWDNFSTTGTTIALSTTTVALPTVSAYSTLTVQMKDGSVPGSPNAYTSYSFPAADVAKINAAVAAESSVTLTLAISGGVAGAMGEMSPLSATYTIDGTDTGTTIVSETAPMLDASQNNAAFPPGVNPYFSTIALAYTYANGQTGSFPTTGAGIVISKSGITAS